MDTLRSWKDSAVSLALRYAVSAVSNGRRRRCHGEAEVAEAVLIEESEMKSQQSIWDLSSLRRDGVKFDLVTCFMAVWEDIGRNRGNGAVLLTGFSN